MAFVYGALISCCAYLGLLGVLYTGLGILCRFTENKMERWYLVRKLERAKLGEAIDGVFCSCQDAALQIAMKRNPSLPCYVIRCSSFWEREQAMRLSHRNDSPEYWWTRAEFVEFMKLPTYQKQKS